MHENSTPYGLRNRWHGDGTALAGAVVMGMRRRDAWRRGVVVLAVLLTLASGLCLFDQDGDEHDGMALDFCLLMVFVVSVAPVLLARPLLSGLANTDLTVALATVPARALDPPPKRARHF